MKAERVFPSVLKKIRNKWHQRTKEMRNKWNSIIMCITRKISFCLLVFIQITLLLNASKAAAADPKVDICTSLCRCGNETGIEKIHCDFNEDKVSHTTLITEHLFSACCFFLKINIWAHTFMAFYLYLLHFFIAKNFVRIFHFPHERKKLILE